MKEKSLIAGIQHTGDLPAYNELDQFRRHLEHKNLTPEQQPYLVFQSKARNYQIIFSAIGVLFLGLCGLIYTKNMHWAYALFFQDGPFLKGILYMICGGLSLGSFVTAYKIRPEREAIAYLKARARKILRSIYHKNLSLMGIKRYMPAAPEQKQVSLLKYHFHQAWDQLNHAVKVTDQLVLLIATSHIANQELRVKLYNQAILELQDKLATILQSI